MTSLVETGTEGQITWTCIWHDGHATEGEVIIANYTNYPMEIITRFNYGFANPDQFATQVIGPGLDAGRGEINDWRGKTIDYDDERAPAALSVDPSTPTIAVIGTDSLVSTVNFSDSSGVDYPRLVLMPGEILKESGSNFTIGTALYFMAREMKTIRVIPAPNIVFPP